MWVVVSPLSHCFVLFFSLLFVHWVVMVVVCFVSLLWTEMHWHPDRKGVSGASGRGEGHIQLPGLSSAQLPFLLHCPAHLIFIWFDLFLFFNVWVNKVWIPLIGGHLWVCRRSPDHSVDLSESAKERKQKQWACRSASPPAVETGKSGLQALALSRTRTHFLL